MHTTSIKLATENCTSCMRKYCKKIIQIDQLLYPLYRHLLNTSNLEYDDRTLEFNAGDGTLKYSILEIVNLNEQLKWEKVDGLH